MLKHFFLEFFIAFRYLRGQGRTVIFSLGTRLSFFFMALMVFIMVVVLSFFTGFQKEVHNSLWNSGYHITILRQSNGEYLTNSGEVVKVIKDNPLIQKISRSVFPSITLNGLIEVQGKFEGKSIRALPVSFDENGKLQDFPRLVHYDIDLLKKLDQGNVIIVGREMARHYGWQVGDVIRIYMPQGGQLTRGMQIKAQDFTIAGFFRTGYYEFDLNLVFMSLSTAQKVLEIPGKVTEIIVQLHDLGNLDQARQTIRPILPGTSYLYSIRTIKDERGNFLAALQLEKTLMIIILGLLIIAGIAGIWVTVHLLVRAKAKSIGMLRAMGLPTGSVIVIFTAHSMLIGLLSTLVGGSVGIFVSDRLEIMIQLVEDIINSGCNLYFGVCNPVQLIPKHIYYFDHLPVYADISVIFGVALSTMILSGLAGYFPSRTAAILDPVQTIRNE